MNDIVIETDLFDKDILEFYSKHNLNLLDKDGKHANLYKKYYTEARGGEQGDYRLNIQDKIDNVIDCLTNYPSSKRAVITIPC